jgi:hypothetical protein
MLIVVAFLPAGQSLHQDAQQQLHAPDDLGLHSQNNMYFTLSSVFHQRQTLYMPYAPTGKPVSAFFLMIFFTPS